mmetsp:Transcript_10552/g.13742  ORF Transcript_10552/g.13742 Transcript_10552/m.13742 type:complete len:1143 (-) Transcript_10552:1053-4481(-)
MILNRSTVKTVLEGEGFWGRYFATFLSFLVTLSASTYSLSTVDEYEERYNRGFLIVEYIATFCFTLEYCLRVWVADSILYYAISPIAVVDLLSFLPSWFDLVLPGNNFPALQFLRVIRLLKLLTNSNLGSEASDAFVKSFREQKGVLVAASFAGGSIWIITSSLLYLAEKENTAMEWCYPNNGEGKGCVCNDDGCTGTECICMHRFRSIPSSMFFVLLNLSGEFPLADKHSSWGRLICVCTAILSVGFFSIPVGLVASTIERSISAMNKAKVIRNLDESDDTGRVLRGDEENAERIDEPYFVRYKCYKIAVCILCFISACAAIVSTIDGIGDSIAKMCQSVDVVCALFFLNEHMARITSAGVNNSLWPILRLDIFEIVDLLAWAPTLLMILLSLPYNASVILIIASFRLVKFDRYMNGFLVIRKVIKTSAGILAVGAWTTICCLIICSAMMYYAERGNPDPNIRKYYKSVPDAMWLTLLNLSGEAPLCDYSTAGKIIVSFLSIFAVPVLAVPIGAIEAAFTLAMEEINQHENPIEVETETSSLEYRLVRSPLETQSAYSYGSISGSTVIQIQQESELIDDRFSRFLLKAIVRIVKGYGKWGDRFIFVSIFTTIVAIILEALSTTERAHGYSHAFDIMETILIAWFTLEFMLRAICLGKEYLCSKFCIVDALATFPWYLGKGIIGPSITSVMRKYDGPLRMFRLLRIFSLDRYAPSITLLDDAVTKSWKGLAVSGWLSFVAWYGFNGFIYIVENNKHQWRFRNALSSGQFSAILLTSDYPLVDFSPAGRVGCSFAIVLAVAIVSTPSALVAESFTDILAGKAEERRRRRQTAAVQLQKMFRNHLRLPTSRRNISQNQFLLLVSDAREHARALRGLSSPNPSVIAHFCMWKNGKSSGAGILRAFIILLILLNGLAVILESIPEVKQTITHLCFQGFETVSVIMFTIEYILNCLTSQYDPKHQFSMRCYTGSFIGLADLLSIAPFFVQLVLYSIGVHFDATVFRIARVIRIIELEHFFPAFSLLDDVFQKVSPVLKATGVLAAFCWIAAASLFYFSEPHSEAEANFNKLSQNEKDSEQPVVFTSVVDAMFYTAIFLTGEWAVVDFTPMGALVSVFTALVGTALFSTLVGALMDAFQDMLTEQHSL